VKFLFVCVHNAGRSIGKSNSSRKTMSEAKWGKVVDLIDSCDI